MEMQDLIVIAKPIAWRRGYQAGFSTEDREDLLQDVLMKYVQAWPDDDAPLNVAAWFETCISNAIIDRARLAQRRPADPFAEGGEDPLALAIAAMGSSQFASAPVVSREILKAILALVPAADGRLLQQRYLQNRPAAQLAAQMRISVANLDQRTTRAKQRLRAALTNRPDLVEELRAPHPHVY